ncbi:MAG TPA: glycoside hydrolase family 43 protein [Gemmataceae bacterium]|nr:glycoside hydrolase family 43 protein [Gemmataceae bacterium]
MRAYLGGLSVLLLTALFFVGNATYPAALARGQKNVPGKRGNPVIEGWYADPEAVIFGKEYWIYPTFSAPYDQQVFLDAFSSSDLVTWKKHPRILDSSAVTWAKRAMWAPAIVEKNGKYYLFFSANDIQEKKKTVGGIGVAVADHPAGPFKDYLGKPLIGEYHNGAQPIDQFIFKDKGGAYYILYGGHGHCNIARLNDEFTGLVPLTPGSDVVFKEITPKGYVEGPFLFLKDGRYYLMWSEGGWTGPNYAVAYGISDSLLGPYKRVAKVLSQDPAVATGAGHHSLMHIDKGDEWYIVYHRRPLGDKNANHRVVCIDRMYFDDKGLIKPIAITHEGVGPRKLDAGTPRSASIGAWTFNRGP